jgi:hypothetical protein
MLKLVNRFAVSGKVRIFVVPKRRKNGIIIQLTYFNGKSWLKV